MVEVLSLIFPLTIGLIFITSLAFTYLIRILPSTLFLGIGFVISIAYMFMVLQMIITRKLTWKTKEYRINKDRIVVIDGVLGSRERIHNLKGMTNMQLHQGPLMKKFNYGIVTIYFLGGGEVSLTNIDNPHKHVRNIQRLLDQGYIDMI